jgi:FkbM family methyltransferase
VYSESMLDVSLLKRKCRTAARILRDRGAIGFLSAVREWVAIRSDHVKLDGCTFTLKISDDDIKLRLVRKQYEEFERRAVQQHIRPEFSVVELGSCIGVVACVTNRVLQKGKVHVVVEANPWTIPVIEANRALNHSDFEILNAAIAYDRPSVTFCPSMSLDSNSLRNESGSDPVTVDTVTLRDIITQREIGPFALICDIEGHEYDLVQHEADVLRLAEIIILETHARFIGEAKNSELLAKLKEIGFEKIDEQATVLVLKRSA